LEGKEGKIQKWIYRIVSKDEGIKGKSGFNKLKYR